MIIVLFCCFQLSNPFWVYEMRSIALFHFGIAGFTEAERNHSLMALAVLLFHGPLLIITE